MAKAKSLQADTRARTGSGVLNQMRREGWTPAVLYGGGAEATNLKVDAKTFSDLLAHSASENILVDLDIKGDSRLALIQDVQHDPLSGKILHADFFAVNDDTQITATIPVVLTGEARGVKNGGLLDQMIHDLEITCVPKDLPDAIKTDVTELRVGQSLTIGQLGLPEGVESVLPHDILVASIVKGRTAVDEAADDEAIAALASGGGASMAAGAGGEDEPAASAES